MTVETPEPDLMLLQRFSETGNPQAFAEIVQRYARVVYSAAIRILGDEGGAQDVSQETFFRLMQQPKLVTLSLAGWLHRTATHLALDVRRSEMARKQREKTYTLEQEQARSIEPRWAEVSALVDQALDEIEEPTRSLLIRHFLEGVQQADLAVEINVSAATLSRRIKAGLLELQRQLKQKGVYIGLAALTGFCVDQTAHAVPFKLLSELGKMQMIATFRQLPPASAQPLATYPVPYQLKATINECTPAKFTAMLIVVSLIVAGYAFATTASWVHATFIPAPHHVSE